MSDIRQQWESEADGHKPTITVHMQQGPSELAPVSLLAGSPTYPYVLEFGKLMEEKLARNRHKGNREGWINDDPMALLRRLRDETEELADEMDDYMQQIEHGRTFKVQAERVAEEAADIANFAMMIADWYKSRAS